MFVAGCKMSPYARSGPAYQYILTHNQRIPSLLATFLNPCLPNCIIANYEVVQFTPMKRALVLGVDGALVGGKP